jgi:hypothetical protein
MPDDWRRYLAVPEPFGEVPTLRRWLAGWMEVDEAACVLGVSLGVFEPDASFRALLSRVSNRDDNLGDELVRIVRRLVEIGLLESRENGYEVRWPTKPPHPESGSGDPQGS